MLNAIPEWIASTKGVSTSLLQLAQEKIQVMKGNVGVFDEDRLDSDLNTQLRCIRLICNHSKHKTDSPHIPTIKSEGGIAFPITFPGTFVNMIFIGEKKVNARKLILDAYNFWKNAIDTL
jgi:hypothetical protein